MVFVCPTVWIRSYLIGLEDTEKTSISCARSKVSSPIIRSHLIRWKDTGDKSTTIGAVVDTVVFLLRCDEYRVALVVSIDQENTRVSGSSPPKKSGNPERDGGDQRRFPDAVTSLA